MERAGATQICLHTPSQPCTGCTRSAIPGDNLTACRNGRIRSATSTFCASLPSSQIEVNVLSYTACPAVISRTLSYPHFPLYHHYRYTHRCNHTPIHPLAHAKYITHHRPSIHSPSTPPTHQPSISTSLSHQPRVYLMTGASSNKPAV